MRTVWRAIVRTVFWSYERGTWPYDVAVVAIVLFVLLSPRSWFHDQPQVGSASRASRVEAISEDPTQRTTTYRVDADLIVSARPTSEISLDTHQVLRKNVNELKDGRFQILHIEPVRAEDGTVLYYAVSVKK